MESRVALITGSAGGIGKALVQRFAAEGYSVIGLDIVPQDDSSPAQYVQVDLIQLCRDDGYRGKILKKITSLLPYGKLDVLINNAALQVVAPTETLSLTDWHRIIDANVIAPFVLTQGLLSQLSATHGSVVNISSIHAQATKPGFVAYATSKAALSGLTRAMAVDVGDRIRVNAIAPAAIATEMLKAGFSASPEMLEGLRAFHPVGDIGEPIEVAEAALMLASHRLPFLNGAVLSLDGGISSRLHDPI